jgi:ammonia channel protein AmtB
MCQAIIALHREVSDVSSEGPSSEVNDVLVFSRKDEILFVIFRELYLQITQQIMRCCQAQRNSYYLLYIGCLSYMTIIYFPVKVE